MSNDTNEILLLLKFTIIKNQLFKKWKAIINNINFHFIDCSVGFVGDNCTTSCSYPSYGALCNETCDCLKSSCHHVYGCNYISLTTTGKKVFCLDSNVLFFKFQRIMYLIIFSYDYLLHKGKTSFERLFYYA